MTQSALSNERTPTEMLDVRHQIAPDPPISSLFEDVSLGSIDDSPEGGDLIDSPLSLG